ncbi:MAG: enoyl-CoA hydratase/isomerase family protein [Actinomycetota bacterium]
MSEPALTQDGELFVIDFGDDLNTTDVGWVEGMNRLLDEVEAVEGPKVLITTGSGKHYSNGLDVEYMGANPDQTLAYVQSVERVLARILTFPAPTVAAVNGHAFGAGAFALIAHDHVVMREDRGFVCWPEVHLGMPFSPGLMAMVKGLLPPAVARETIVTGRRYSGPDAVAAGFVDRAVPLDALMGAAAEIGLPLAATAEGSIGRIKRHLHRPLDQALGSA